MGIEITDDELLSMDPKLLLELQAFLKEHRKAKAESQTKDVPNVEIANNQLTSISNWALAGAVLDEVEDSYGRYLGIRVTQNNVTYIARNWRMTDEVKQIFGKAVERGFDKFWRFNHPQNAYLFGGEKYMRGSHHIGCSPSHSDPWVFVLGAESLSRRGGVQKVKEITFNTFYQSQVARALGDDGNELSPTEGELLPGNFKIQKGGGKCVSTHPADFAKIIDFISSHFSN